MYMNHDDKRDVIKEVHRVIPARGEFWIWDSKIKTNKEGFLIILTISLPGKEKFDTGYSTNITDQDEDIYKKYLNEVGFFIEEIQVKKYWFLIRANKI